MIMLNLLIWPTCSIFTAHTLVITALALVTSQLLGSIKHPSHLSVCPSFQYLVLGHGGSSSLSRDVQTSLSLSTSSSSSGDNPMLY